AHAGMIMSQAESKQSAGRSVRRIIPEAKRMGTAVLDSRQEHAGMTYFFVIPELVTTFCHPRMGLSGIHGFPPGACGNDSKDVFHLKRKTVIFHHSRFTFHVLRHTVP
ncbi:MAG: hypothetical protein KBA28_13285, partial [Syntrophaceae bacterium]|nr:hypothetical protein [Syntrophaceae bacterium]